MRFLHVNSAPKWNGEAAHSVELCAGLAERGHEVLWIGSRGSVAVDRAREAGIPVDVLQLKSSFNLWREMQDVHALRRHIRRFRPDIVHCHRSKDHLTALIALRWWGVPLRPLPIPLARTRHVVMPLRQGGGNNYFYRKCTDLLLAVSRPAARSLGEYWPGCDAHSGEPAEVITDASEQRGIERCWERFKARLATHASEEKPSGDLLEAGRAAIILSAANTANFSPERRDLVWREQTWGIPPEAPVVGLVGRIQRIKGQKVFLAAAEKLAERFPAVHFVSIGPGNPERIERLQQEGTDGPLGERWHVLGMAEEIEPAIASLDVGVVASLGSEASSRVTYEYLASAVPRVVATAVGGIPDMAEALPNAPLEIVEPGDEAALAEAIGRALEGLPPQDAKRCVAPELARVVSRDRWLDDMEAVYREFFGTRSKG